MNKQDLLHWKSKLRIGNYLRELSIVIIGVAITLYAGNLISGIKEKKDIELQLAAVYNELEDNFKEVRQLNEYNGQNSLLRYFLLQSVENPQPSTNDSIMKYENLAWTSYSFTYKRNAYDMFINSGAMKLLSDRELLLDITESYSLLETLKAENDSRFNSKLMVLQNIYGMPKEDIYNDKMTILSAEMNHLFNYHALYSGSEMRAEETEEQIESTLSGKLKDYRQGK